MRPIGAGGGAMDNESDVCLPSTSLPHLASVPAPLLLGPSPPTPLLCILYMWVY